MAQQTIRERFLLGFQKNYSTYFLTNGRPARRQRQILEMVSGTIQQRQQAEDRKSTRLNSSHMSISYAVFCLKKKKVTSSTTITDPMMAAFTERFAISGTRPESSGVRPISVMEAPFSAQDPFDFSRSLRLCAN